LLAGDVDFIAPVPPADLPRLQRQPAIEVVTMTGTRIITLQLNQQRVPAFADPRVRRAVRLAINNVGISEKIMRGFATPAAQLSPPGYPGHDPTLVPRFDLAEARQLLQQAGHGQGLKVTMLAPNNRYVNDEQIAQAVVGMLAKIGIGVELKTVPKAQYWPLFDQSAADMLMLGWQSDTEDSGNFFEFMLMTRDSQNGYGQYNSGHYRNPALDALLLQAQTELDPARRAQLLQQAERLVHDDAAIIPLHWQNLAWAARRGVRIDRIVNVMDFPYLGDLVIE
ncbi:MAG TPA: ABC transporter substrate-binding protein, partial [Pseudomonadales bacterium]|nr:ABC transporter substrate-binding protein [Pseudomonadales bacterium]